MRKFSHWLEELAPSESLDLYRELALSHAATAWESGCVQGQIIHGLIRADNIRKLCEFEFNYEEPGLTAHAVKHCRQALAFFQKITDLDIGIDKEEVALKKALDAEELCRQSNEIFRKARRGEFNFSSRVSSIIHAARLKIARVLGPVPRISDLRLRFGPGATRGTKRTDASIRRKLAEKLQCSEELSTMIPFILEELPHLVDIHSTLDRVDEDGEEWSTVTVELMPSKLNFVPKNAKTYRSINVEPGLNTCVQLAIGDIMTKRLLAFGIDTSDQTLNQRRALEGSLTGALATLDLSSASDTISRELVYELLPLDWAVFLARARSAHMQLPSGEVVVQEKFSSMGNGYTFPLETLIFWSLAAACCPRDSDATAYGDDLIVPTDCYVPLVEVLQAVGFVVNLQKSYHTGKFRESCGKDYFGGIPVRPCYQKRWASAQSLFVLHNFYVRNGDFERASRVETYIHPALRIYGPDGYGDGHLLGDHPRRRPAKYHLRGYSGYFFDSFSTQSNVDYIPLSDRVEFVASLYTIYRRSCESIEWTNPTRACLRKFLDPVDLVETLDVAPLPLPSSDGVKGFPLPGTRGYKKVSIYTLRA